MCLFFICLFIQFVAVGISLGYDDISAYKPTGQRTYLGKKGSPQKAVDRSLSTCSTKHFTIPEWWYVDLGKVKSIYDIQIYFRLYRAFAIDLVEGQQRVYGYELFISNSTDISLLHEAYQCYNQTRPEEIVPDVTHICVSFGRYVIFYNKRLRGENYPYFHSGPYIQLCEVIVQGCEEDGVYGNNCNKTCPTNCQERRCYITNGTCDGCKDGWTGEKCLFACPAGKYGAECKNSCTDHCGNNTSCNHVTGQCEGCLSGWMGYDCNERDPPCTYLADHEKLCSVNCINNDTCYNVDGYCPRSCRNGFRGNRCDEQGIDDFKGSCQDQRNNVAGLVAILVISLLIDVGLFFIVLYFIRKKDNKKENDQPSYKVSDRGRSQQRSTSGGHLENHKS
ncbi:cell death abnormality protein 1-like [Saccostrea cucullata]|uniref:cell death abnormality protein 1-like n=1 Tax=Saccostrea cuccullata TaxID=36930 RepID=UPI002ED3FB1F